MSDAIGGVVNVALIVFFIVAITSYMAFNVNYEKAFNVKNEIVSLYEEYEGRCNGDCKQKIREYEDRAGYGAMRLTENDGEHCYDEFGYCVRAYESKQTTAANTDPDNGGRSEFIKYCYYGIRTNVFIDIPIINNLMNLRLFHVTGQTKTMKLYAAESATCDSIVQGNG